MKHGFSFDTDLCVKCRACVAACTLENGFQPGTRNVYTYNELLSEITGVVNISLACNHCDDPACLTGCPAKAYSRDSLTNAVIHDPDKCIGCGFCTWRCPYDAPKMNRSKGHVEKCSLCIHRLHEDIEPACVTACPTGAIRHIYAGFDEPASPLLPESALGPSLVIRGRDREFAPVVYPQSNDERKVAKRREKSRLHTEWSLFVFTVLVMLAAAFSFSGLAGGMPTVKIVTTATILIAIVMSLSHLGKIFRAWRAPVNIVSSPLSREIVAISLFAALSLLSLFIEAPALETAVVFAALMSLVTVDMVYLSADRSAAVLTHSGQTLFSALLTASFMTSSIRLFALLSVLAVASAVFRRGRATEKTYGVWLFIIRQITLVVPLLMLTVHTDIHSVAAVILFAAGILTDRALFYLDFNPENIKQHIENLAHTDYEKKRD